MENKNSCRPDLGGWEGEEDIKVREKAGNGEECGFSDKSFKLSWGNKNFMLVSGSLGLETLCAILRFVQTDTRVGFGACLF